MPYQNKEVKMGNINTKNLDEEKKIPNGVDETTYNQYNTKFTTSDDYAGKKTESDNAASNYKDIISTDSIISNKTQNAMNQKFVKPSAVTEADTYLASQLQKIQSGKTSYSDQVKDMMDKIMNREKFSYDVDTDPLFQQALASAMNSGKQAMQDTIGQASALTGGYGSTYATSAGNQAYNSFIEDAYDNIGEYYQMAMQKYQMDGDEMYRQFGMLSELDDKEYNRNIAAYDATYQHRNQLYNEAYTQYRDNKSDAFAMANLELNEYGQRVSDAYNYYNIASNEADKQYEKEYQSWSDSVNQAYQMMNMQNTDWWNQTNFDEGVRQYEQNFAEQKRQYDQSYAQTEKWNQKELDYKYYAANKSGSSGSGGSSDTISKSIPSDISKKAKSIENDGERFEYISKMVDSGYLTDEQADYLIDANKTPEQLPLNERTWTKTDDGGTNWFGGIDGNAKAKDQYGNEYSMGDLYDELKKTMSNKAAKDYILSIQKDIGLTKK